MPTAKYYRQQAEICTRLALIANDPDVAKRLVLMAQEYTLKAAELEGPTVISEKHHIIDLPQSSGQANQTAVPQQEQQQQQKQRDDERD